MAGGDDLGGWAPIGLAGGDSIGEGAPRLDHRPGLAGRKKLGGEAANSMGDASSFGVALAGEARAGTTEEGEASIEGVEIVPRLVELCLLDASAEFFSDAAPRHDFVEKGIAVGCEESTGGGATMMGAGNIGIVIAGDELHLGNAIDEELFDVIQRRGRHTGLIVAGVSIEPECAHSFQHGRELLE